MGASDSKTNKLPFIKSKLELTRNQFKIEELIAVRFIFIDKQYVIRLNSL